MVLMLIIGNAASFYFNDRMLKTPTNVVLSIMIVLMIVKNMIIKNGSSSKTNR
jgi:hypothetical protein